VNDGYRLHGTLATPFVGRTPEKWRRLLKVDCSLTVTVYIPNDHQSYAETGGSEYGQQSNCETAQRTHVSNIIRF